MRRQVRCWRRAQRGMRMCAIALALAMLALMASGVDAPGATVIRAQAQAASATQPDFPTVDPAYIYGQLAYMATHFQHREAGYDNNLPVQVNGHDEFAAYWQATMLGNLQGFGASAVHDSFHVDGWQGRPATTNAFNVEVSVPGMTHPDQVVVIGCHYDAEATSTQSANDDGSGCAIELGVARAFATYWRAHHLYPARTLRFVIFDAEEQGLYGSFHYVNQTVNGDLGNIVAMFNEEQNGIGYPLRYLGKASNPLLPTTTFITPLTNNDVYGATQQFTPAQRTAIASFRSMMAQAAPAAFAAFRALGYGSFTYHDAQNQPVTQQIFTASDLAHMPLADDNIASSDQYPFGLGGLPTATFIGNYSYYDKQPPPWSYPYDQPDDTIQLMNVFASGSPAEAKALQLSLALPGMLTTWALAQPAALGFAPADGKVHAAIGDIPLASAGQAIHLNATAIDTAQPSASLTYHWDFGDGASADGASVSHTWAATADYALRLTVTGPSGASTVTKTIGIGQPPVNIANPYSQYPSTGMPPSNPAVTLPSVSGVTSSPTGSPTSPPQGSKLSSLPGWVWAFAVVVALLALTLIIAAARMHTRPGPQATADLSLTADEMERRQRAEILRRLAERNNNDSPPPSL